MSRICASSCSNPNVLAGAISFGIYPTASVSGLYFAHPDSAYFGVGKVERDQVADYAKRKGWTIAEAERWLAPVLNYVPERPAREKAA